MNDNAAENRVGRGRTHNALVWFLRVPLRRQTYLNLGYLLLAFPLGLGYFVVMTVGLSLSVGLAIVLVGFGLFVLTGVGALVLVSFERWLTNRLLGSGIRRRDTLSGEGYLGQAKSLLLDRRTWSSVVYLPVKFVLGLVGLVTVFTGLSTAVAMMLVPLYYDKPGVYVGIVTERAPEVHQTIYLGWNYLLVGFDAAFTVGYWHINTLGAALLVAILGAAGVLVTLHLCNALVWMWSRYAHWSMDGGFDIVGAIRANQ